MPHTRILCDSYLGAALIERYALLENLHTLAPVALVRSFAW
jgi:hypothetical protein